MRYIVKNVNTVVEKSHRQMYYKEVQFEQKEEEEKKWNNRLNKKEQNAPDSVLTILLIPCYFYSMMRSIKKKYIYIFCLINKAFMKQSV